MVLVRRKRVLFHDVPDSIRHLSPGNKLPDPGLYPSPEAKALAADPEVFYVQETGEVFLDYECVEDRVLAFRPLNLSLRLANSPDLMPLV